MATYTYNQWIFIVGLCYIFYVTLTSEAARSTSDKGNDRNLYDIGKSKGFKTFRSMKRVQGAFTENPHKQKSEKPNIILVLTDDQDEMLGSMSTMTKTLKIMAQEGVQFNNSFVSTPMCCPSRSSLLTGMLPHNHHVYTNNDNCSGTEWQKVHEPRTFAKYLSDAGYRTGFFGKYLNEYNGTYIPPGWREWVGLYRNSRFYNYTLNFNGQKVKHDDNYYQDYFTDLIANDSVTFLKQSKQYFPTKPVMMMLSVPAPHGPEDAAPQFQHMFENNTLHRTKSWNYMNNSDKQWLVQQSKPMEPKDMAFTDMLQQKRLQTLAYPIMTKSWNYMNNSDKQWLVQQSKPMEPIGMAFTDMFQQKRLQTLAYPIMTKSWNYMNNSDKQWLVQQSKPMEPIGMAFTDMLQQKRLQTLQSVDSLMDKVHYQLRLLGELDNTYIIYTSDHGYHLGQYGIVKGKALPYDFDIRVPLYIRGPGILRDTKIPNMVGNIDLAPTILDMAGLAIPEHMDGRSMLKLIRGHKHNNNLAGKIVETRRPWRDTLLIERGKVTQKMIKSLERKQIKNLIDENDKNLLPYATPKLRRTLKVCRDPANLPPCKMDQLSTDKLYASSKLRRTLKVCRDPANLPPCKMDQKWVCFKDSRGRKRIKKCRNFNKTVAIDNEIGYQRDSPYTLHQVPPPTQQQCVCPDGRMGVKTSSLAREYVPRYHKKRSLRSYDEEEMKLKRQLIAQQLDSNRQRCRFYPNETFACDAAITKDPQKWQSHKLQLDEMIAETRKRLRNLKKIRKNLKKQRKNFGKEYTLESNKSGPSSSPSHTGSSGGYNTLYNTGGDIHGDCDCSGPGYDDGSTFQIPPELMGVGGTPYEDDDSTEESEEYTRYQVYGVLGRRGMGREAKNCNHDGLKCTVMSNDHWQTPPYWRLGDYCFCSNAVSNTYWCMRTVNATSNFLYCEFIDSFLSYYDFIADPDQLENRIRDLSYGVMQQLHEELTEMRECVGWKQCSKNNNKKHSDFAEKRRRRRRKVKRHKRHRPAQQAASAGRRQQSIPESHT